MSFESPSGSAPEPTHRAILTRGRPLVVVPWSRRLQWAEYAVAPVTADALVTAPQGQSVFEVWAGDARCVVRRIGGPRGDATFPSALRTWIRGRALSPVLLPALPDRLPPAPVARIPARTTAQAPAFRFVWEPWDDRLRVLPWGRGAERAADDLREPWLGAVGDLVAVDSDRARATVAPCPPGAREGVTTALDGWAREDDWTLEIEAGDRPLAAPSAPPAPHPRWSVCRTCGDRRSAGWASGVALAQRGFLHTRCGVCGGRHAFAGQLEGS